jgi:serine/threonine protein kinase
MMDQLKREISAMKIINHPNVVKIFEVMASKTKIYIVLELVSGGELFDKIVSSPFISYYRFFPTIKKKKDKRNFGTCEVVF